MTALIVLLVALQALDAASTLFALRLPGLGEANPILRPLFERFGAMPVLLAMKGALIALLLVYRDHFPVWLLALGCIVYTAVVINNLRLIAGTLRKD